MQSAVGVPHRTVEQRRQPHRVAAGHTDDVVEDRRLLPWTLRPGDVQRLDDRIPEPLILRITDDADDLVRDVHARDALAER